MSADDDAARFVALSVALTGFDEAVLHGTGQVAAYLDTLLEAVGERHTEALLSAGSAVAARAGDRLEQELRLRVFDDERIGPVARSLTVLWYTGQWTQLPAAWRDRFGANAADETRIVSPDAYQEGLVWLAAGTHPQGAKPMGYGAWSLPPDRTATLPIDNAAAPGSPVAVHTTAHHD